MGRLAHLVFLAISLALHLYNFQFVPLVNSARRPSQEAVHYVRLENTIMSQVPRLASLVPQASLAVLAKVNVLNALVVNIAPVMAYPVFRVQQGNRQL